MKGFRALYHVSLLLLPRDFRKRHHEAMRATAEESVTDAAHKGWIKARLRETRELGSVVGTAWKLRRRGDGWPVRNRSQTAPGAVPFMTRTGMTDVIRMLRQIGRSLLRHPGYTAAAVVTLTLGIGINSAMFAVVYGVLVRPLPFENDEELVFVFESQVGSADWTTVAPGNYVEWQQRAQSFSDIAAFNVGRAVLTVGGAPEQVLKSLATPNLFSVLGTELMLGEGFPPNAGQVGAAPTVVLSHGLWTRLTGADREVIGRSIEVDGVSREVVGVLPSGHRHPDPTEHRRSTELYTPLTIDPTSFGRFMRTVARLAPGATIESAASEMDQVTAELRRLYPAANENADAEVRGVREQLVGDRRAELLILAGAVAVMLLIVSVNLAGLVLVRGRSRSIELGLRQALGAGTARIVGHVFGEVALLVLLGTAAGLGLAAAAMTSLNGLVSRYVSGLSGLALDWRVVGFTVLSATVALLIVGAIPAAQALRLDLRGILVEGGARGGGTRATTARSVLVMVEVALTVMLVSTAGLLARSFVRLVSQPTGFQSEGVLTFTLRPPVSRHPEPGDVIRFYADVERRLATQPGIQGVAWTQDLPFTAENWGMTLVPSDGPMADRDVSTEWKMVSSAYFGVMGMTMEEGRTFTVVEGPEDPTGIVVNRTLAEILWPNMSAVGRIIPNVHRDGEPRPATVVGVVSDLRDNDFRSIPDPLMYVHHAQFPRRTMTAVVRTASDPASYLPILRGEVAAIDDQVALGDPIALDELLAESVATPRLLSTLIVAFGAAAMLLAAFGIYGVVANSVSLRVREFGIRMALGARGESVLGLVLRDSTRMGLVGAGLGLLGSLAIGRVLAGILFEVSPWDPVTLSLSFIAVVISVTLAAYLPARRAAGLNPVDAIRSV